jgi:hypothetical protein
MGSLDARYAQRASAAMRRARRKHSGMTDWLTCPSYLNAIGPSLVLLVIYASGCAQRPAVALRRKQASLGPGLEKSSRSFKRLTPCPLASILCAQFFLEEHDDDYL